MDQNENLLKLEKELIKLNSTEMGRRAFLSAMPILLASCASSSKNRYRYREGDNSGQQAALTVAEERRMTAEYIGQMRKEYPPHPDQEAQRYVQSLGQKLVRMNNLQNNPYQYDFTLVQSKMVNAFALPAGKVFVTAPLLAMADSEAELAGVIGHEVGHIKARHTAERIYQAKKQQKKTWLYAVGGGLIGGAAGFRLGKLLCSKEDRECLARAAMYGAGAGVGGGLLIQKFAFMANSREDEMEADRIGFRTSVTSGYHKDYVGNFYSKLLVMEKQYQSSSGKLFKPFTDAMSTHPPSKERVAQMNQMAAQTSLQGTRVSSNAFEDVKRRI